MRRGDGRGWVDGVRVEPWSGAVEVGSAREFVGSLERTNAPIVLMRERMGEAWAPIGEALRERMGERFGDGPQTMTIVAYLTVGRRG